MSEPLIVCEPKNSYSAIIQKYELLPLNSNSVLGGGFKSGKFSSAEFKRKLSVTSSAHFSQKTKLVRIHSYILLLCVYGSVLDC